MEVVQRGREGQGEAGRKSEKEGEIGRQAGLGSLFSLCLWFF